MLSRHNTVECPTYRLVRCARRAAARRHCLRLTHDGDAHVCARGCPDPHPPSPGRHICHHRTMVDEGAAGG
eukprot:862506-Pleurochrysis_carterae.AAC.1